MDKLTKEQYEKIKHLDKEFWRVRYSQYKRATRRCDNELVAQIMEEVTGQKQAVNFVCSTCIYNLFYEMTKYYFPAKEVYEANTDEKKSDVVQVSTDTANASVCSNGTANNENKQTVKKSRRNGKKEK